MNTYTVQIYPDGFNQLGGLPLPITIEAREFTTTEDYVVFIDDSTPPRANLMVPFSLNPVVLRTATA